MFFRIFKIFFKFGCIYFWFRFGFWIRCFFEIANSIVEFAQSIVYGILISVVSFKYFFRFTQSSRKNTKRFLGVIIFIIFVCYVFNQFFQRGFIYIWFWFGFRVWVVVIINFQCFAKST